MSWSNSAFVIAPLSSRPLADAIWSAGLSPSPKQRIECIRSAPFALPWPAQAGAPACPFPSDQVDQDAQPGNEDHEQHPERLCHAAQVLAAEDVAEDPEKAHEPGEKQEEFEQREYERTVVVEHAGPFRCGSAWSAVRGFSRTDSPMPGLSWFMILVVQGGVRRHPARHLRAGAVGAGPGATRFVGNPVGPENVRPPMLRGPTKAGAGNVRFSRGTVAVVPPLFDGMAAVETPEFLTGIKNRLGTRQGRDPFPVLPCHRCRTHGSGGGGDPGAGSCGRSAPRRRRTRPERGRSTDTERATAAQASGEYPSRESVGRG